jgi:HK97 family phage major capsid protein
VGDEPLTYSRESPNNFLRDAITAHMQGGTAPQAVLERLQRHREENVATVAAMERAASDSTNFAGLVVPQYLTDMVAPVARAMRPFADICAHHDLPPDGMTVNISRITTGTSAAAQATEGSAFSTTAIDDTLLTIPVVTIGGYNDLSVQAVMRGTGVDEIVTTDLIRAYHTEIDRQTLVGSGGSGEMRGVANTVGINAVTYTDATPTVPELYSKIADGEQRINAAIFARATHIAMAPRRLGWFKAGSDANGRPYIVPMVGGIQAFNSAGGGDGPSGYGNSGYTVDGLPVVTDGNVPLTLGAGTEDEMFVVDANELHLWEQPGMPLAMRFEQPVGHQGQIRIVVFGFAAFTAGRYPAASSLLTGTGLIAPTF